MEFNVCELEKGDGVKIKPASGRHRLGGMGGVGGPQSVVKKGLEDDAAGEHDVADAAIEAFEEAAAVVLVEEVV